jgi:hypothetical protein
MEGPRGENPGIKGSEHVFFPILAVPSIPAGVSHWDKYQDCWLDIHMNEGLRYRLYDYDVLTTPNPRIRRQGSALITSDGDQKRGALFLLLSLHTQLYADLGRWSKYRYASLSAAC